MLELKDVITLGRMDLERACKDEAQSAYLGNNMAACRILGHYKLFVDTRDHGFGCNVMLDGYWEMWLTQFIARYVKPGMNVVDVGANYGYYSVLLGDVIGENGKMHCIEPNPAAVAMLKMTIGLNGLKERTTIHQLALGSAEARGKLSVPASEPKNSHIISDDDVCNWTELHEVAIKSLDDLLAEETAIDFVKIDTEGSEEQIITGMKNVINKFHPAIVLEFNTSRYSDPAGFFSKLSSMYSKIRCVGFDGTPQVFDHDLMLSKKANEDWLLYLSQ